MKYIFRCSIVAIILQLNIIAQYEIRIVNQQLTPDTYFFDVEIKNDGEEFILGSYQCIFDFNNNIIESDSKVFQYVAGTSLLSNIPSVTAIELDGMTNKLCFAAGAGEDIISSEYKRIGRFGLFGTFSDQDSIGLQWSFNGNIRTIIVDADYNEITKLFNHLEEENPLPVELISFNSKRQNDNILLLWETATELNSYGFELERKGINEDKYTFLAFIKSAGGTTNARYSFSDKALLLPGEYVYRLKQIDNDGTFEYLPSINVVVDKPVDFKLYQNYPNPFNALTNIKYTLKENSRVELSIYDIQGKLINKLVDNTQESGFYSQEWIADDYASGIYICQIRMISIESGELFSSIIKMILLK